MRRPIHMRWLPVLLVLAGCSESAFSTAGEERLDAGGAVEDDTNVDGQVRIDVFPSQTAEFVDTRGQVLDLRPQTFIAEARRATDLDLVLTPAIAISGRVEGIALTPWPSAELPTVERALTDAEIRFGLQATVQQPRTTTDADGEYQALVVPSDLPYEVAILPDAPDVPVRVQRVTLDGSARRVDLTVDAGVPVWGTLVDGAGEPMADLEVTAVDDMGLRSAPTLTDARGRFQLIVAPGQPYTIEAAPTGGEILPTLRTRLDVVESSGANADGVFGGTSASTITGLIRTPRGDDGTLQQINDGAVRVRITATSLDGFEAGTARYQVEVGTNGGRFTTLAPRGNYRVEVLPQANEGPSPLTVEDVRVGTSTTTVNGLDLPRKVAREGLVIDESGAPIGGAGITCTEDGYAERTFSTSADPNGAFVMLAPLAPMICTVSPPQGLPLASTRQRLTDDAVDPEAAWTLLAREGSVLTGRLRARLAPNLTETATDPVATAVVQVRGLSGGNLLGVAITDEQGRFSIRVDR